AVRGLDDPVGHEPDVLLRFLLFEAAADEALHREDRVLRVGHGLALGRRADQHLALFGVGDDGGRRARAFRVLDHLGLCVFDDGDAAVGGAEVDADDFCHDRSVLQIRNYEECDYPESWVVIGVNWPGFQRAWFSPPRATATSAGRSTRSARR